MHVHWWVPWPATVDGVPTMMAVCPVDGTPLLPPLRGGQTVQFTGPPVTL